MKVGDFHGEEQKVGVITKIKSKRNYLEIQFHNKNNNYDLKNTVTYIIEEAKQICTIMIIGKYWGLCYYLVRNVTKFVVNAIFHFLVMCDQKAIYCCLSPQVPVAIFGV